MRYTSALILLLCSASALAQNYYIPDNNAAAGISNVIPFGTASPSNFSNCRMHVRATPAELGNLPNLITGLGFAPSNSGIAHFDSLTVVMDHIPAAQHDLRQQPDSRGHHRLVGHGLQLAPHGQHLE